MSNNIIERLLHKDVLEVRTFFNTTEDLQNTLHSIENYSDQLGRSVLHLISNVETLKILLDIIAKSSLLNRQAVNGQTPLVYNIASQNSSDLISLIIKSGADVNIPDKRSLTALHYAVQSSNTSIMTELLQNGANVDVSSTTGCTPLYLAVLKQNLEAVYILLYYNADVTIPCYYSHSSVAYTPFLLAILKMGCNDIVNALLDYIPDLDWPNNVYETALQLAITDKNPVAFELVSRGANVNLPTSRYQSCIGGAFSWPTDSLFKVMWPRVDLSTLWSIEPEFLARFINLNRFSPAQFLNTFYLIMDCNIAYQLIEHCDGLIPTILNRQHDRLTRNCIEEMLYSILVVRDSVVQCDLETTNRLFGIGDIFGVFVNVNVEVLDYCPVELSSGLAIFIDDNFSGMAKEDILKWCQYYAFNSYSIQQLCNDLDINPQLQLINESVTMFPSLLELCRKKIRRCCKSTIDYKRPFAFIHAIKKMGLYKLYEDILLLQHPIYQSIRINQL